MERGYVKLWRKTLDSGLLMNPTAWQLFGYLLLNATRHPRRQIVGGVAIDLQAGDSVFGRARAAVDLKLSEQNVRTALNLLVKLEIVTIRPTNKCTIVSFVNWATYQEEPPADSPAKSPACNQHVTSTSPQDKKERKNKREDSEANASSSSSAISIADRVLKGRKKSLTGKRLETFEQFWEAFAYKHDKANAIDAWASIPTLTTQLVERICDAARRTAERRAELIASGRSPQYAQGWLNSRRWEDEDDDGTSNRGWTMI